ncbi:SDR family oxidoreductase [Actinoallomurus iriomotensis]|uniref:SDR family oxidoreductase n=1 Tax=Actinoallomurus iriomotensis TaxID=478107 RepID=UPI003D7F8C5F
MPNNTPMRVRRTSAELTRYRATEFGGAGIRVNGVGSGPVRTQGTEPLPAATGDAITR